MVTASDSRGEAEDTSGAYLKTALAAAGHVLAGYRIVRDEPDLVRAPSRPRRQPGPRPSS